MSLKILYIPVDRLIFKLVRTIQCPAKHAFLLHPAGFPQKTGGMNQLIDT